MCWAGKNYPKIAIIDIKVFKIVIKIHNYSYSSYYHREFIWKIKERKESEINVRFKYQCFTLNAINIYDGLHSYNSLCNLDFDSYDILTITSIDKYTKLDFICSNPDLYKLDCVIPKGSEYYVNKHGEFVSNALIPVKAISIYDYMFNKKIFK